jgi:hypothetical protein
MHEFVEFLYDFVPEQMGRFVPALQSWDCNATPQWVGERIAQHFNHIFNRLETIMAARKPAKKSFEKIEYEFVRGELNADQKKDAAAWMKKHGDDYAPLLDDLLASDYKLSMSFDAYNDTFVISLTGKPDNAHNAGKILTGRGKSWFLGLMSMLYKHHVLFKGGAWVSDSASDDGDFS